MVRRLEAAALVAWRLSCVGGVRRATSDVILSIPVEGATSPSFELRNGSDPCDAILDFCVDMGDVDDCRWQMVKAVQPMLEGDWARSLERFDIGDGYFLGCEAGVDFECDDETARSKELVGFLESAIASRDPASPLLHRYNQERGSLSPEERVAHYRSVARLLPTNSAALDGLATALRWSGMPAYADLVLKRGVDVLKLWTSIHQRPASGVDGLAASPFRSASVKTRGGSVVCLPTCESFGRSQRRASDDLTST